MKSQNQTKPKFTCACEDCGEVVTVPNDGLFRVSAEMFAIGWTRAGGFMRFRCGGCSDD